MHSNDQADIDARIQSFYSETFDEDARLASRSAAGPLEFQRTQEIIAAHMSGGRVLDVGGGTGRHALALVARGFDVELVDPVARHVEAASRLGVSASVGDARSLDFADDSFDAVLVLGPLYHLSAIEDRLGSLREAARVTRPGGLVFAAALSRFIAFGASTLGIQAPSPYPAPWIDVLENGTPPPDQRFPAGHFHSAEELEGELEDAGLEVIEVVGVEGPAGLLLEELASVSESLAASALEVARAASAVAGIRDLSAHLLGIGAVPGRRPA